MARAALLVMGVLALLAPAALGAPAAVHQVAVGDNFYDPILVQATVGDTVVWTNVGGNEHSVTYILPFLPGSFDSGGMQPGDVFAFTFATAGVYVYHCNFHPQFQNGVILVLP